MGADQPPFAHLQRTPSREAGRCPDGAATLARADDGRRRSLISTSQVYTESAVGDFFDQTLQTYLSFWDAEGILHTGYLAGAERTSDVLAAEAGDRRRCPRA
jgi:hypothetical protein